MSRQERLISGDPATRAFCEQHGLTEYQGLLEQAELTPCALADCTDGELKGIGLPLGAVKKIRRALQDGKQETQQRPPTLPPLPPPPAPQTNDVQQQLLLQQQQQQQNAMLAGALAAQGSANQPVVVNNNNNNNNAGGQYCGVVMIQQPWYMLR